jgi:O-antigen ligase
VFGEGTASYPVLAQSYFKDPEFCSVVCPHPHNQFLLFYFELGLAGLALMFWFMLSIVRQAFEHRATHRALMLAFVVIMVISNMTHSSLWLSTESHFFIMVTALLMASASRAVPRPPPAPAPTPA